MPISIPTSADVQVQRAFREVEDRLRKLEAKSNTIGLSAAERREVDKVKSDVERLKKSPAHEEITTEATFVSLVNFLDAVTFSEPVYFTCSDVSFSDSTRLWGTGLDRIAWDEQSPTSAVDVWNLRGALHTDGPIQAGKLETKEVWTHDSYVRGDPTRTLGPYYSSLEDDFNSGHPYTANVMGRLGWTLYGSAGGWTAGQAAEAGRSGIYYIGTATMAASNILAIYHSTTAYSVPFDYDGLKEWTWIIKGDLDGTAANRTPIFAGITSNLTWGGAGAGNLCQAGVSHLGFHYNPSLSEANWYVSHSDGSNRTQTDTGIAYTDTDWYKFRMVQTSRGNWSYYINGDLIGTISSNIPSDGTATQSIVAMESNATNNQNLYYDYMNVIMEQAR